LPQRADRDDVGRGAAILGDVVIGEEHRTHARLEARICDVDALDRLRVSGYRRPYTYGLEETLRGGRESEGACVGARHSDSYPVDHRDPELRTERVREGASERQAGKARPGNCDIEAIGFLRHVSSAHLGLSCGYIKETPSALPTPGQH